MASLGSTKIFGNLTVTSDLDIKGAFLLNGEMSASSYNIFNFLNPTDLSSTKLLFDTEDYLSFQFRDTDITKGLKISNYDNTVIRLNRFGQSRFVNGLILDNKLTFTNTAQPAIEIPLQTNIPDVPTTERQKLISVGSNGGLYQVSGRGGLMLSSNDDSLILANGDIGRTFNNTHLNASSQQLFLLSDDEIVFKSNLKGGWDTENTMSFTNSGDLVIGGGTTWHSNNLPSPVNSSDLSSVAYSGNYSDINFIGNFNIDGSTGSAFENGIYVSDSGGITGSTNNPISTAILSAQVANHRSIHLTVDSNGYIWGLHSQEYAGTYTFKSKAKEADIANVANSVDWNNISGSKPNFDQFTRNGNAVTLSGDVSGAGTVNNNGSISVTNTVVANDSHSHSNYVVKNSNATLNSLNVVGNISTDNSLQVTTNRNTSIGDLPLLKLSNTGTGDVNFATIEFINGSGDIAHIGLNSATNSGWGGNDSLVVGGFVQDINLSYVSNGWTKVIFDGEGNTTNHYMDLNMHNNSIFGVDQIFHHNDTNTYIQFNAEDQFRVVTGGAERFEVNNSQITATVPIKSNNTIEGSHILSGTGSGGVGLTINDGHGNANLTFNHAFGKPDQNGNSARIEVNTDSTANARMIFELKSNTQAGVNTPLTQTLVLTENDITYKGHKVFHAGNDGPGSGLDADLLDGAQGSAYARRDQANTFTGNLTISSGTAGDAILTLRADTDNNNENDEPFIDFKFDGDASIYRLGPQTGDNRFSLRRVAGSMPFDFYIQDNRAYHDGYHPNADKWTTARTITLNGDASGSVSIDGSANRTLTVTVNNDSHTHDGRYYTEAESNSRFHPKGSPVFSGDSVAKDNITTRTETGFYETGTGTTAEGWPVDTGGYKHLISCTHTNNTNYYSMQIAGSFYDQDFYGRKTFNDGTRGWSKFWTDTNDGPGSGLDADLLDGLNSTQFLRSDTSDTYPRNSGVMVFQNTDGDIINTATGSRGPLEVYQPTGGKDAFMTFHVSGDHAAYFGLSGAEDDFFVGGWSMGANKYKVWHEGNSNFITRHTSNRYAVSGETVVANSSGMSVYLPSNPKQNDKVGVVVGGNYTNVVVNRNTKSIMGLNENMTLDVPYASAQFMYDGTTWRLL